MKAIDRISTLFGNFTLAVRVVDPAESNFMVLCNEAGSGGRAVFKPSGLGTVPRSEICILSAVVDWGGLTNPLLSLLPPVVTLELSDEAEGLFLLGLIHSEASGGRCGSSAVVNRLCEIIFVKMLRAAILEGSSEPGLIAGLSDARLSRALVAIHESPGRNWKNRELAEVSGSSLSLFAQAFAAKVGCTPAAYLRNLRLAMARNDVARGERIATVARRYCYGTPEAFARAFKRKYGLNPTGIFKE